MRMLIIKEDSDLWTRIESKEKWYDWVCQVLDLFLSRE